jgi:hypothetical protein
MHGGQTGAETSLARKAKTHRLACRNKIVARYNPESGTPYLWAVFFYHIVVTTRLAPQS